MLENKISVIGDGGWGTALALSLNGSGKDVSIWGYFSEYVKEVAKTRLNIKYLPGFKIPSSINITPDMEECVQGASVIVLAVPSHVMRQTCESLKPYLEPLRLKPYLVSVSKGIENKTLTRMSEIIESTLYKGKLAVLSGPTHAKEVAMGIPTAAVAASVNDDISNLIQSIFTTARFRVYTSNDIAGVELGGSVKNVIAIAAGICDGLGFGDNTKAALITRGLAEMTRLGVAMNAKPVTFSGLSGMGDLIVTCASKHSRNRAVGEKIGSGLTLQQVLDGMDQVAEGVKTSISINELSLKSNIDTPISKKVYEILYENRNCLEALEELMSRSPKPETYFV